MQDLKSGIEHLKQAKAHMSKANGIMSNCISKLRELEEENAELKAELDDWKGNAEGFQPDAYMRLPLDADGVPIRIDDVVYGNPGIAWTVVGLRTSKLGWKVEMDNMPFLCEPDDLTHKKPDSWEKLEEDASVGAQDYCTNWLGIDIRKTLTSDDDRAFAKDIIRRAKKLAGIEEEAQR